MTPVPSSSEIPLCVIAGASLRNGGGTGVYTRRLISGMAEAGREDVLVALPSGIHTPSEALGARTPGGPARTAFELSGFGRALRSLHPRCAHLPAFAGRVPRGTPYAVTLHDLAFLARPGWFPALRSAYYRLHFPGVARRASIVVVDSDFTAREAVRLLGIPAERLRRIYLSTPVPETAPEEFRESSGIRGDFLLCAATIEPRKNISALLDAWETMRGELADMTLVLAGRWGWGSRRLRSRLCATPGVLWTGALSRHALWSAMAGARLLVYPSLYEGFGLPPLEAAAAGTPSVIGPAEALEEVFGDVAAARCGADAPSISTAIREGLARDEAPESLKEFASRFSSLAMAQAAVSAYEDCARGRGAVSGS